MSQLLMVGVFWFVSVTGGEVHTQKMNAFPLGTWENGDQLFWTGGKVGDKMELKTKVKEAGKYRVKVVLTKAPDYGIVQLKLDGVKVGGQIDLFSTWVGVTPPIPLRDLELTAGEQTLTVTIVGKNKESKGTRVGIDRVILEKKGPLPSILMSQDNPSQLEEMADLTLLPFFRSDEETIMFSSYDRTGGNDDGFSGKHSKLWVEDGNSVLAVVDGPGVVERLVFTHSQYAKPGLLGHKGEHIRFYLDGKKKPAIDVPIEELFSGKHPLFPAPLAGENQGGCYCYVPISFSDGCKIEVDGTDIKFYHINITRLPNLRGVSTFTGKMGPRQKKALERIKHLWSHLGDAEALGLKDVKWMEVNLDVKPGKTQEIRLPAGGRMVRAVELLGDAKQLDAARKAQVQFFWDHIEKPAVDLSAEFFFCRAYSKPEVKSPSLLAGATDRGWYNFMPMPYRDSGVVVIRAADKPVTGKLRVAIGPFPLNSVYYAPIGYLHTAYNENMSPKKHVHHQFLKRDGKGHYLGTYMVTRGKNKVVQPSWLEGDEYFYVDGELVAHGTGSEDYFNCGWYSTPGRLDHPGGRALGGFSVFRNEDGHSLTASYRWHVPDPIPYNKTIDAKIEHGAGNTTKAEYRSAAFYYDAAP